MTLIQRLHKFVVTIKSVLSTSHSFCRSSQDFIKLRACTVVTRRNGGHVQKNEPTIPTIYIKYCGIYKTQTFLKSINNAAAVLFGPSNRGFSVSYFPVGPRRMWIPWPGGRRESKAISTSSHPGRHGIGL